ncbi:unnamed protein product, partial [Brenthis ino]
MKEKQSGAPIIPFERVNERVAAATEEYTRPQLLEIVNKNKPEPVYSVDAILTGLGHKILRLPPYRCDLNPIEMVWASMKRKVAEINIGKPSNQMQEMVQNAFDSILVDEWRNHCAHVKKIEKDTITGAERQKRYKERLKIEHPEKYEEKRKKHLDKVKQRQKKIANLSKEEKLIQRKKWREANKKRKDKKQGFLQKQNKETLKKRREIRSALYRSKLKIENEELRKNVTDLNRKIIALQKKLYRYRKKKNQQLNELINNQTDSKDVQVLREPFSTNNEIDSNNVQPVTTPGATPLSKTISFIDSLSSKPIPDVDKNKIKKKIFELNVLSDSLKSQYKNANTNVTKAKLKNIADNEITTKYRMKFNLSLKLGLKGRIRNRHRYKNPNRILEQDISNFFLRDDISRSTAGRSETRTLNKIKMQKRF